MYYICADSKFTKVYISGGDQVYKGEFLWTQQNVQKTWRLKKLPMNICEHGSTIDQSVMWTVISSVNQNLGGQVRTVLIVNFEWW